MHYEEILQNGYSCLKETGIEEWESDGWILFSETFQMTKSSYFMKKRDEVTEKDSETISLFEKRLKRRIEKEPVQYIIGNQEFCGLLFHVRPGVLIPRLDTEVLVDEMIKAGVGEKRVLDLCTGSGCIILTLEKLAHCKNCVATDLSKEALQIARENAALHESKVQFLEGDLYGALDGLDDKKFDVIVSNPPYIDPEERKNLLSEVRDHEPAMALFAEEKGLYFYRKILERADEYLNPHGQIFFEIGYDQGKAVKKMCEEHGFGKVEVIKDLAGLDRVVKGEKNV